MAGAVKKFYSAGDLIYSGEPFAHVLYRECQGKFCDHCLKRRNNLKRCGSCKFVSYCGEKCQKEAWKEHKKECPYLHRLSCDRDNFVRLLGKVIFKLKGNDWKACKETIKDVTMSFDDLISHSEERKKDPLLSLHSTEVIHLLECYIGQENLPEENDLLQIIGKLKYNRFGISNGDGCQASALYLGASVFDHSCIPNAVRVFTGKTIEVRAIKKISKNGIRKVTISYVPVTGEIAQTKELYDSFFGPCYCLDCSLPYGESVLTKIIDKRKAYGVIEMIEAMLSHLEIRSKFGVPCLMSNVDELLHIQEGVLGDTNILRIRLLIMKCSLWPHTPEILHDLKKLIYVLELVFGSYSAELEVPYSILRLMQVHTGNRNEMFQCTEKLAQLRKIIYGDRLDLPRSPEMNMEFVIQNFLSMHCSQ